MHILGIDYGTKRIGLAWSDTTLGVVLPYGVVEAKNQELGVRNLVKFLRTENINKIVVGFPLGLNGKENANTKRIKEFVFALQQEIDIPIEYYDERFSSQAADALGGGVSRDEKSAMVILDGYLEAGKARKAGKA